MPRPPRLLPVGLVLLARLLVPPLLLLERVVLSLGWDFPVL